MQTVVVLLCAALALAAAVPSPLATCPTIITRDQWGARDPESVIPLRITPVPFTVIHHSDSESCTDQASCSAIVRRYQDDAMDLGSSDIGYNFLIGEDGNAYEGIGWDNSNPHLAGVWGPAMDRNTMSICFIGNFMTVAPNAAALATAQQLMACGVSLNKILPDFILHGHRQLTYNDCPGDALLAVLETWPNWPHDAPKIGV